MEVLLTDAQFERLGEIARAQGKDQAALVREAVDRFLDEQAWVSNEIARGLSQAEGDNLLNDEEVRHRIEALFPKG